MLAGGEPGLPVAGVAGEGVQIDFAGDAGDLAGAAVLPEGPALACVKVARVGCDRAQPEISALDFPHLVVFEEVDGGVKDRALAVVRLQGPDENLRLGPDMVGAVADAAGRRCWGPFHIQHRGKRSGRAGDMGDEPAGLLDGRAAVVKEMVSAARDACAG